MRVRDMSASVAGSYSMLSAFADADVSAVPRASDRSVVGERDGADAAAEVEAALEVRSRRRSGVG